MRAKPDGIAGALANDFLKTILVEGTLKALSSIYSFQEESSLTFLFSIQGSTLVLEKAKLQRVPVLFFLFRILSELFCLSKQKVTRMLATNAMRRDDKAVNSK